MTTAGDVNAAAYGGPAWSPRTADLRDEIGQVWGPCGIDSEWAALRAVLLHEPGRELEDVEEPDAAQMLAPMNPALAIQQHRGLAQAYEDAGVTVHYVHPKRRPPPNSMFVADLMLMTKEGAILGRPASTVRAGEEVHVARRLADLDIPILRTVRGTGTFEGADAAWVDPRTVLLATGLRTNREGARQIAGLLGEMGVKVVRVTLPRGTMHLMGTLRFAGPDLAIAWPESVPHAAIKALRARGYSVLFLPGTEGKEPADAPEQPRLALNFVTLGPRHILMAAGHPATQRFFESAGIVCETIEIDELAKAAGGIGCLTGILERERTG